MGKIIQVFLCIISGVTVFAQPDSILNLQEEHFIAGSYSDFYVDNLSNIYLLNTDDQIKKINDRGDSVSVFNAMRKYGDIYSMDVTNPLKILVYYKDFGTIVLLDRFLSSLNTIDLRKYGILQAKAVAQSYDNNYWVFDQVENKLKKIDDYGNTLLTTPDFRMIFNEQFVPLKIIDYNNLVYLYDKEFGWMIFDYYGAFKQKIELPGLEHVQVERTELYGSNSSNLYCFDVATFKERSFDLVLSGRNIKIQKGFNVLYVLQADGLHIYTIQ